MNKRWAVAGAMAAIASVGAGTTVGADPPAEETYTCNGVSTTFEVHGRMGILVTTGERYLAHNVVINGSFDPAGPAPVETFTDTKWTTGRTGGLNCSATETFSDEEGTGTFTIRFNALPIH